MKSLLNGIKSIEDFELQDQRVFLRLDLNVPMKDGTITDLTRIQAALPTIRYALEKGAKLVVASHLGRPESANDKKYSLEPVAQKLGELLGAEVILVEEADGDAPKALLRTLRPMQFLLLENVRFHKDETKNGEGLAKSIAEYTDIYINDAFGASHRAHSTIVALPGLIKKKGIGFLMKREIEMLEKIMRQPERPFVVALGGSKVSDKIGVIENLIDKVDDFLIGGAMAYTFLAAEGVEVGKSKQEKGKVKYAAELMERMRARGRRVHLPLDHVATPDFNDPKKSHSTPTNAILTEEMGVDIGPKTRAAFATVVAKAKTIFWNGPMGVFETSEYAKGTFGLAQAVAESDGFSVIGGGDSASAVVQSGFADRVSYISTGGGASLELLQGDKLPGIEALRG